MFCCVVSFVCGLLMFLFCCVSRVCNRTLFGLGCRILHQYSDEGSCFLTLTNNLASGGSCRVLASAC